MLLQWWLQLLERSRTTPAQAEAELAERQRKLEARLRLLQARADSYSRIGGPK